MCCSLHTWSAHAASYHTHPANACTRNSPPLPALLPPCHTHSLQWNGGASATSGTYVSLSDIDLVMDADPATGVEMVVVADTVRQRHQVRRAGPGACTPAATWVFGGGGGLKGM